jgi:hypothetical protein
MPPLCKYCGQSVRGQYITALGATWHPEHFLCAGCGQPLIGNQFQLFEGKPYHVNCYLAQHAPRCTYCGQPLLENYLTMEGKTYHTTCFREHVAPRCVYCQKPLTTRYLTDGWGESFCPEHEDQYPRCAFCSRLIPPQQQTPGWRDYESLRCTVCRSVAVETSEEAQPPFTQCKQWLSQQGFRFNQLPLRLELRKSSALASLLQNRSVNHPLGVTLASTRIQNGSVTDNRIEGVVIQQGMPAMLFMGVTIHELGHVWLAVQGIQGLPLWAEEGFAQLLAHRYYKQRDTNESRYHALRIEQDSDPIYGNGFRRIQALSEQMGFARFVEALRITKRLPTAAV